MENNTAYENVATKSQNGAELEKAKLNLARSTVTVSPRADIFERKDALVLMADMPGVDQEKLDLGIEKNALRITGFAKIQSASGRESERVYKRAFTLPDIVDTEAIEASIKNGVLTIVLPKAEKMKPRRIAVKAA